MSRDKTVGQRKLICVSYSTKIQTFYTSYRPDFTRVLLFIETKPRAECKIVIAIAMIDESDTKRVYYGQPSRKTDKHSKNRVI